MSANEIKLPPNWLALETEATKREMRALNKWIAIAFRLKRKRKPKRSFKSHPPASH